MPPTDYPALVYAAALACLRAGVTAYNADVAAGLLPGCRAVDPKWVLDDRPATNGASSPPAYNGRELSRLASGTADSYPRVELHLAGVQRPRTSTRTFGTAQGLPQADGIVAVTVTLRERITHPPELTADAQTTPLESYVDRAWASAYPKLGMPYGSDFARRSDRRELPADAVAGKRVARDTVVTVTLALYLSELR